VNYIAIAIAPGIAICVYFILKDIYNREPKLTLFLSFIFGCLAIIPAVLLESKFSESAIDGTVGGVAIFSYLVVALSEEASKFAALRFYSYNRKSFDEPMDGIVYSIMVGMGFATIENIFYVLKFAEVGRGIEVGISRMFLSVPAHATFAVVMGYFVGKAKFNPQKSVLLMLLGLFWAVFFHGTFDFFLFINEYSYVGKEMGEGLLAGGAIVSFVISIIFCRKLIRKHRSLSKKMFEDKNNTTDV